MSAFIALKKIKPGDELCISYIEDEDSLKVAQRNAALQDYLFVCECSKCLKARSANLATAAHSVVSSTSSTLSSASTLQSKAVGSKAVGSKAIVRTAGAAVSKAKSKALAH